MLKYCSIGSGSSGNCHVVTYKDTGILVDAGLAGKTITSGIQQADFDIEKADWLSKENQSAVFHMIQLFCGSKRLLLPF